MSRSTMIALTIGFGVAGVFAPTAANAQQMPLKMTFSGTMVATTIDIAPATVTDEEQITGSSTLGNFTLRKLRTDDTAPTVGPCGTAVGPNFKVSAGAGVFRFEDGSLLMFRVVEGSLCIDFSDQNNPVGRLSETYQITGGTGRFQNAATACAGSNGARDCTLKSKGTLSAVMFDAAGANAKLLTITGEYVGTIPAQALAQ